MMELRPYQKEAVDAIAGEWSRGVKKTLLVLPTGCHEPAQGVLMADGTIRRASEIETGDLLVGDDGTPRRVLMLHHGRSTMYRVTPVKGNSFIVNGDHILPLVRTNEKGNPKYPCQMLGGSIDTVKTKDWNSKTKWYRHIHKLFRSDQIDAFKNDSYSKITVDPYFLGVLLGDGGIKTCINITTPEREIADVIKQQADLYGMGIREMPAGKATTYFLKSGTLGRNGGKLHNELVALNVYKKGSKEKGVPLHYKTAPIAVRLDVLAGLIDTDGTLTMNGYDFISASKQLSEDVAFIARSSGLAAYVSECIKSSQSGYTGTYWRVSISGNCDRIPLRVARKKADRRKQKKSVLRTGIKKIEKIGEGEYFGFTVDGNNLYLLDDFTVTHNCGKTICFAKVIADRVKSGDRCLVLAHRGELLQQAADKLAAATGLMCAVEKAQETCIGSFFRVAVGSVQTLMREKRLRQFPSDHFDTIVVDEAHHVISESYQRVLDHFPGTKVLGVTATPDRGDMKNLGSVFETLAYEYTMPKAIRDGYLCPIKAQTIPLKLDLSSVGMSAGDFKVGDLGNALDSYLSQIAGEMTKCCKNRKTVVFLPLIKTSQKFCRVLNEMGFAAAEVNGESKDREEVLRDFQAGKYDVLCNSMLLTEGWDCPSVDCIIVLRPTKIRSLYCLDKKTEILTENGWSRDIKPGEHIKVFDPKTGEIKTDVVKASIRRPIEEDEFFCSYESQSLSIRVTNKHRMLYDNKRKKGWKFKTAEQLSELKDGTYLPISGHGSFKGVSLTNAELRFIGWFLSDGTHNKTNNAIYISQAEHQPWIGNLEKCIKDCGFKYGRQKISGDTNFKANSSRITFSISYGEPRGRDKRLKGWSCLESYIDKNISDRLLDMTEEQFDIMLETIHLGNGAKQTGQAWTRHSYHISTPYKEQAERLQIMAVQRGWKANLSIDHNGRNKPLYILHMKKKDRANIGLQYDGRPTWIKEHHSEEQCWCIETETGTIITRRNGKVAIMGNCQMVGRGTRLSPETGKDHLLLLDFLWHTERHQLCHPASLICESEDVARKMTKNLEEAQFAIDLEKAEQQAAEDVVAQREEALAKQLKEMQTRKRKLVDPLQFELSIQAEDLINYRPAFGWQAAPASEKQLKALEKMGIFAEDVENAGKASLLLDKLSARRAEGLATPKQIRFLERKGFMHVGTWDFESANNLISRIANNGWKVPYTIDPAVYRPEVMSNESAARI